MKKFLATILLVAIASIAICDIHEPPKYKYTKNRKLARGFANMIYGWHEIPTTMYRKGELHTEQSIGIWVGGFFKGIQRTGARFKYGVYEVVNFQRPLYKDSYRPPYADINYLPMHGYEEFPPQIGNLTTVHYVRGTTW